MGKKISELVSAGTLLGGELVPVVQSAETKHVTVQALLASRSREALSYSPATDLHNGTAIAADTWVTVFADQAFTVVGADSEVVIRATGAILFYTTGADAGGVAFRVAFDAAGGSPIYRSCGAGWSRPTDYEQVFDGVAALKIPGLSQGSHMVRLQIKAEVAGTLWLRAASVPDFQYLEVRIVESGF